MSSGRCDVQTKRAHHSFSIEALIASDDDDIVKRQRSAQPSSDTGADDDDTATDGHNRHHQVHQLLDTSQHCRSHSHTDHFTRQHHDNDDDDDDRNSRLKCAAGTEAGSSADINTEGHHPHQAQSHQSGVSGFDAVQQRLPSFARPFHSALIDPLVRHGMLSAAAAAMTSSSSRDVILRHHHSAAASNPASSLLCCTGPAADRGLQVPLMAGSSRATFHQQRTASVSSAASRDDELVPFYTWLLSRHHHPAAVASSAFFNHRLHPASTSIIYSSYLLTYYSYS